LTPPEQPAIQQRWRDALVGMTFAGVNSRHAKKLPINGVMRYFWVLKACLFSEGQTKTFVINEDLQPVELTVTTKVMNNILGQAAQSAEEKAVSLKEVGLSEEALKILVGKVVSGGDIEP
jgi:hypothetical protein